MGRSIPEKLAQVCNLAQLTSDERDAVLQSTAVNEVWAVGTRIYIQLMAAGIHTVLDLMRLDSATVRRGWSVVLERTVRELQGTPCIDLEHAPAPKKEIACTRSLGHPVTELTTLNEAVTEFASRAGEKFRRQHSLAGLMTVPLRRPTADTGAIVQAALTGRQAIYRPGFKLAKAGVMLLDLQSDTVEQRELDLEDNDTANTANTAEMKRLMATLDGINQRYGRGTMTMASAGLAGERRVWSMKQLRRTPAYSTCIADIAVARA